MKRTTQTRFLESNIVEPVSTNAKSLCANGSSMHDLKIKKTYSIQGLFISNTPQIAFSCVISKLYAQARAHLRSPASSLINIFTNTFHVKQSLQRAQSFTWNVHNILSYV